VNRHTLWYLDQGAGQPLVLVHGWGADHTSWRPVIDQLTTRYRVIAVDLRGHGRSQAPDGPYVLADLADDLFQLLASLDLPEAPVVVGHSLGGMVVQQFAADHPDAACGMVLLDTDLNAGLTKQVMTAVGRVSAAVMRLAARLLGEQRSLALYQPVLSQVAYSGAWRRAHPALIQHEHRQFPSNNTVDGLAYSLAAYASRPDLTDLLRTVRCRALLVRGSRDVIMTEGKMDRLRSALPDSTMVQLTGSGHMTIAEQPRAVADLIDAFATDTPIRRRSATEAESKPSLLALTSRSTEPSTMASGPKGGRHSCIPRRQTAKWNGSSRVLGRPGPLGPL
jgi:pimeloyl-ACP methyl ester carboxylesterase